MASLNVNPFLSMVSCFIFVKLIKYSDNCGFILGFTYIFIFY